MTSVSSYADVELRRLVLGNEPGGGPVELELDELRRGLLVLGRAGSGKTTLLGHLASGLLGGLGRDVPGSLLVLDSSGDLVNCLLRGLRADDGSRVRHLNYSGSGRMPLINLLDPELFPDEARCVENLVSPLKRFWHPWSLRTEDLLRRGLSALHQYNAHPDTLASGRLGFLDLLLLLDEGVRVGTGVHAGRELTDFQRGVVSRVSPGLREWFSSYFEWSGDLRAEAFHPVQSRLGAYVNARSGSSSSVSLSLAALGQRKSTVSAADVTGPGLAVLASVPVSVLGVQPAAILGSALSGLPLEPGHRWVVSDRMECFPGLRWPWMLDSSGETVLGAVRGLWGLHHPGVDPGRVRAVHVSGFGALVAFGVSAEDSAELAGEFGVSPGVLLGQGPWACRARMSGGGRGYRAASFVARCGGSGVSGSRVARAWSDSVGVPVPEASRRAAGASLF